MSEDKDDGRKKGLDLKATGYDTDLRLMLLKERAWGARAKDLAKKYGYSIRRIHQICADNRDIICEERDTKVRETIDSSCVSVVQMGAKALEVLNRELQDDGSPRQYRTAKFVVDKVLNMRGVGPRVGLGDEVLASPEVRSELANAMKSMVKIYEELNKETVDVTPNKHIKIGREALPPVTGGNAIDVEYEED